jgi:nuclear pore complex protein Nup98-Nup96
MLGVPTLSRPGFTTVPPIERLRKMTQEELANVESFTISCQGHGSLMFPGPTDLRGLDLDALVKFHRRPVCVDVYPKGTVKPPIGQGLNKDCIVSLVDTFPKDPNTKQSIKDDDDVMDQFEATLRKQTKKFGGTFLSWNRETGLWRFGLPHFETQGTDGSRKGQSRDEI